MHLYVDSIKEAIGVQDDETACGVGRLMLQETEDLSVLTHGQFDELARRAFTEYARRIVDGDPHPPAVVC
jgi:hypothetical protein